MIADRDKGITVQSTVTGEAVAMGIREEDMGHLMGVLTDLYSNKVRAVIREYTTNALDAQIEAGVMRPIEVTLPGQLSPFFKVRDYGTGLTVDDITSIYSQYGRSTKRGTNDAVGMLGLGCKAALTYCSMFTVASVKDGVKIIVQVSRDEDGRGSMTVVDTSRSDEPTGTEVTVPCGATDYSRFQQEAADFYSVWKPGTVLVNGRPPERFEGLRISDNLYITQSDMPRIVMGNVAYPAPQLRGQVPSGSLLAFVPIGAVNFPPSREALMDTSRTKATIQAVIKDFHAEIHHAIQREVNRCKTPAEAVKLVVTWQKYVPRGHGAIPSAYTFKGTTLPTVMDLPLGTQASNNYYGRMGTSSELAKLGVSEWPKTVFVENFSPQFSALHKRKLRRWCADQGIFPDQDILRDPKSGAVSYRKDVVHQFVCVPAKLPDNPFIDRARVADWEVVRKIALDPVNRRGGTSGRIPGSYDVWLCADGKAASKRGLPGADFPEGAKVFYHHGNIYEGSPLAHVVAAHYKSAVVVCLPANRIDKFKRDVPGVKTAYKAVAEAMDGWVKTLTVDQRTALTIADQRRSYSFGGPLHDALRALGSSSRPIADPDLREAVRISKLDISKVLEQRKGFSVLGDDGKSKTAVAWRNPLAPYLLATYNTIREHRDHVIDYINAAHAAKA